MVGSSQIARLPSGAQCPAPSQWRNGRCPGAPRAAHSSTWHDQSPAHCLFPCAYLRRERACPNKTMPPFLEKLLPYVVFSILALVGVATAKGDTAAAIFIAILVLALLGAAFTLFQKFLLKKVMKSSNSYQVCIASTPTCLELCLLPDQCTV